MADTAALRIYIAGRITGVPDFRDRFKAAAITVATMGHVPVSPLEVCAQAGLVEGVNQWREYMIANIRALLECDGAYFMDMWWDSAGARIEHTIAVGLGLVCLYETTKENRQ